MRASFKPAKFVHQVNYKSIKRTVVVASAAVDHEHAGPSVRPGVPLRVHVEPGVRRGGVLGPRRRRGPSKGEQQAEREQGDER